MTGWPFLYDHANYGKENVLNDIAIDENGNVYATGYGWTILAADSYDQHFMTQKFMPNGTTGWASDSLYSADAPPGFRVDYAVSIAYNRFSDGGMVYVAGASADPTRGDLDIAIVAYNPANGGLGFPLPFAARYNNPTNGNDIPSQVIVAGSNIYAVGTAYRGSEENYVTIRVKENAEIAWSREHFTQPGTDDEGRGVAVLEAGRVASTGKSQGATTDVDIGTVGYSHVPPDFETIAPTQFNITAGVHQSGTLSSLATSDDDRLEVQTGPSTDSWPIKVVIQANVGDPVTELCFRLESHVTSPNVLQRIEFYDYVMGAFVQLDSRHITMNSDRIILPASRWHPSRYIDDAGNVMVRVSYKVDGIGGGTSWRARIDHAVWEILR